MKPFSIPVAAIGPGSQAPEPLAVERFAPMEPVERPAFPKIEAGRHDAAARTVQALLGHAEAYDPRRTADRRVDVTRLDPADDRLLNEALGQGEVSIVVTRPGAARIQETAFAGVWRVRCFDASGAMNADYLELAPIPDVVRDAAASATAGGLEWGAPPAGVMNAESILKEIRGKAAGFATGQIHVINLSLLPVSPEDVAFINATLGTGPVTMLSRGYGKCRITATTLRHVWLVQYFNLMDTLILNTIEITAMPEVALAAPDDIADAARRLEELAEWMLSAEVAAP